MLPKKPRILLVDDDPEILRILEHLLRRSDYEPYAALNGLEGLRRVEELKPDLLIVDMMMPVMTGPQLIQALRTNPAYARLPVLVMSSLSRLDDKNEAFRAGADDYLTKPTRPADFLARVETMLNRVYAPFRQEGQIIALWGGSQTTSTSTVPLNLAVSMALHDHRMVLVELYTGRGAVRHYVDVPAGFTFNPLLELDGQAAARFSFEPYLLRHSSGLVTLPAMASPFSLTANQAQRMADMLRQNQDYLMMDLSLATQAVKRLVAEMADHILLTSEPTTGAVGELCQQLELLLTWGLDHKVSIVLAGGPIPGLSRAEVGQEIERLLFRPGHSIVATIPPAPDLYNQAAQLSLPLVMYDPASAPAKAYTELALWLAQQEPVNEGRVLSVTS